MNLNVYDNADKNINGRIWLNNKKIYTKAVTFRKYYYLLKRYDSAIEAYTYYILLSDKHIEAFPMIAHETEKNRYGTVIISLYTIFNELPINNSKGENINISLSKEEDDNTGEIYKLTIL